jgi:hypothetical protein
MLGNRPLLSTARDRDLFVDRVDELTQLHENARQGLNTLILGAPGVGKTSLLRRFEVELEERLAGDEREGAPRLLPVLVPARTTSPSDFVLAVFGAMIELLEQLAIASTVLTMASGALAKLRAAGLSTVLPAREDAGSTIDLLRQLRLVGSTVQDLEQAGYQPVFLVDEIATAETAWTIFGQMRDELWTTGGCWVVAGRDFDLSTLLRPPADSFFERKVMLSAFSAEAVAEFVRRRWAAEDLPQMSPEDLDTIGSLTDGNPVALMAVLRVLAAGTTLEQLRQPGFEVPAVNVSEPAQRLISALAHRAEPTGASDTGLQREMGWTASRLRQVFRELEHSGVVEVSTERSDHPGRPRKQFVLHHALHAASSLAAAEVLTALAGP